jgi:hypothetical protein
VLADAATRLRGLTATPAGQQAAAG